MEGRPPALIASVVVPVYEDAADIRAVIEALLDQSLGRELFEIIIVDNGSHDDTAGVVKEYEERFPGEVRLAVEDEIQGSYSAHNRGIRESKGRILAFTDADCVPGQDWLKAGVMALEQEPASCGGGPIELTFKEERPNVYEYFDWARMPEQETCVKNENFAATSNFFIWKGLFDYHGVFRTDLGFGGGYEFGRRVTSQGEKLVYISQALVHRPARDTFKGTHAQSRRLASGQRDLEKLGLIHQARPSWIQILPDEQRPPDERWSGPPSSFDKLRLALLRTLARSTKLLI